MVRRPSVGVYSPRESQFLLIVPPALSVSSPAAGWLSSDTYFSACARAAPCPLALAGFRPVPTGRRPRVTRGRSGVAKGKNDVAGPTGVALPQCLVGGKRADAWIENRVRRIGKIGMQGRGRSHAFLSCGRPSHCDAWLPPGRRYATHGDPINTRMHCRSSSR